MNYRRLAAFLVLLALFSPTLSIKCLVGGMKTERVKEYNYCAKITIFSTTIHFYNGTDASVNLKRNCAVHYDDQIDGLLQECYCNDKDLCNKYI